MYVDKIRNVEVLERFKNKETRVLWERSKYQLLHNTNHSNIVGRRKEKNRDNLG